MRRGVAWAVGIAAVIAIQVLIVVAMREPEPAPPEAPWSPITPAPYAALPALIPHTGRPMVLYFWATWCEPCTRHLPETLALVEALRAKGVDLYLVARDDTPAAVTRYFKGRVPGAVIHDTAGRLGDALGVAVLPTSFFVTADGRVVARSLGELDAVSIRKLVVP